MTPCVPSAQAQSHLMGVLTTDLGVDWFRRRSNEHPGITHRIYLKPVGRSWHENLRWFSRRAPVQASFCMQITWSISKFSFSNQDKTFRKSKIKSRAETADAQIGLPCKEP